MVFSNLLYFAILIVSARSQDVDYRLPQDVVDGLKYKLHLELGADVFETNKFNGHLELEFSTLRATNEIRIHVSRIEFETYKLTRSDNVGEIPLSLRFDNVTEIAIFNTTQQLQANQSYIFDFNYEAELQTESLYGLYKSSYRTNNGEERFLATTQFQTTYARRAFPCFDEPSFKGTFDISITHPSIYKAAGNTKAFIIQSSPDFVTTNFLTTPVMPTYLVAFIISDFDCTRGEDIDESTEYQVCSRTESAETRKVAVDSGPKLLKLLEEFTGIPYNRSGITKLDQFAIPDFSAGAMENWGIVTYRETGLLWDPQESTNDNKQRIEAVIAHEFAHNWFGNLVTTHWWSDTFLNEGFARYFQYFTTGALEKTWDLENQFVVEQLQAIFTSDALNTSHALSHPASTPSEVSSRFGSISYNKGASIFRMVEHFIGTEQFKQGLHHYLSDHVFGNTRPEDLWSALAYHVSPNDLPNGTTLENAMKSWIEKPGYPVLNVTLHERHAHIYQERFLTSGVAQGDEEWYVPVTYTTSNEHNKFQDTSTKLWLIPNVVPTIDLPNGSEWIILNNKQIGYYRVNYPAELWNNISVALNKPGFDGISVINRAQLVNDIYNLARIGFQPYSRVFSFLQFLRSDTSYFPWYSAFTAFSNMRSMTGNTLLRQSLSDYILNLMENLYNSAPFTQPNDNQHVYTLKRALAVNWACTLGQSHCINSAQQAFNDYRSSNIKPDKNLRSVIYCSALRYSANRVDWEFLWQKYLDSNLAAEKSTILTSLGCSTDKNILVDFLKKSIDNDSGIKQQDALSVFSAVYSGNPEGVDIAFDFLLENHINITNYYGSMNSLNSLITGLTSRFTKKEQTDKLNDFLQDTPGLDDGLITSAQAQLVSAINNLVQNDAFERELTSFFLTRDDTPSSSITIKLSSTLITFSLLCHKVFH